MALGRVWYGAKYSQRVWERFAHIFGKLFFSLKSRSVNYFFLSEPMLADLGISVIPRVGILPPIFPWQQENGMGTINGHIFTIDGAYGMFPRPQNTLSALN